MLVGSVERCARCGTLLRAGRSICPSCGMDQNAAPEPIALAAAAPETATPDTGPASFKKAICPACMTSVREDTMLVFEKTRMCPSCHERMKGKQDRKKAEVP